MLEARARVLGLGCRWFDYALGLGGTVMSQAVGGERWCSAVAAPYSTRVSRAFGSPWICSRLGSTGTTSLGASYVSSSLPVGSSRVLLVFPLCLVAVVVAMVRPTLIHALGLASWSRAVRMPSAPGLTPSGDRWLHRTMPSPSITKSARADSPIFSLKAPYFLDTSPFGSKSAS